MAHLPRVAHLVEVNAKLISCMRLDHVLGCQLLCNLLAHITKLYQLQMGRMKGTAQ